MAVVAPPSSLVSNPSYHGDDGEYISAKRKREIRKPVDTLRGEEAPHNGVSKVSSNVAGKGLRRKSSGSISGRDRQSSLRRVKNSTDMLRERSLRRQKSTKEVPLDPNSGGREGRKFTVANVGNNGMIYLRLVAERNLLRMHRLELDTVS